MRFRVAVVGVSGYSGLDLLKIVLRHPAMECVAAMAAEANGGKRVAEIHPRLRALTSLICDPADPERLALSKVDTAFLCTPNEVSHELVPKLMALGLRVIDLSGSFRLRNAASYPPWYGFEHMAPDLLERAVYGLSEWNAERIAHADLVANPGCYSTSALIPLLPLVQSGMIAPGTDLICDSKSGVTGAGRGPRLEMLFAEVSENFRPYSPITHRHAPEICQELDWDLNHFAFVPHLLPVTRGILSTIYVCFHGRVDEDQLEAEYRRRYAQHRFIRILGSARLPELSAVNHSNFCDVGWRLTCDGRRGIFFSAIDNLIKGAAGQAVQNFNLMHGLAQDVGLVEGMDVATDD